MRRILKWIGIGFLGLIVLVVVVSLLGGGKEKASPVAQATVAAVQPVAAVATAKPQPSAAPTVAPTVAPTAKPQAPLAKVGQRVESSGIALTVNSVSQASELGSIWKAKDGKTYVVVDVTLENANRDKAPYNPFYFKAKDADGYEYNAAMGAGDAVVGVLGGSGERFS